MLYLNQVTEFVFRPSSCQLDFIGISEYLKCRQNFNFTPAMKALLKRNVPIFAARIMEQLNQSQDCPTSLPSESAYMFDGGNQEVDSSVLSKFRDLNLDDNSEQDETILNLIDQIEDLERQVKEQKDWAQQKAMQAERKVNNDLAELEMLRMEREETRRLNKGKHAMEETTMKRFTDLEIALQKASGQLDSAKMAVKKREDENAEIRAEIEACKLSASEYEAARLEVIKREKKGLKKLGSLEKQKNKLQDNIVAEKQKISDLQQQLVELEAAKKEAEVYFLLFIIFCLLVLPSCSVNGKFTVLASLLEKLG